MTISWGGWTDDDSGVDHYEIAVILLTAVGEILDFGTQKQLTSATADEVWL